MLGFSPFKRHPNRFNYTPRYYDPAREAREQRRAELVGERADSPSEGYEPGQYLRVQREARAARRAERAAHSERRMWTMIGGIVLIMIFVALLYPRLAGVFEQAMRGPRTPITAQEEYGDFDPYAPITVVPNDYPQE